MTDLVDDAEANEAMERERAIAAARAWSPLQPTGRCHWCDEPVADGLKFCDPDCRDDYEHAMLRRV